jgi:hypothetical protein
MIEPRYGNLQTLFADRVFRIPHYQRFYSWLSRQREDLFADLRNLATKAQDQHHFMATIVCHRTTETKSIGANEYRTYDIVDGQQRMTTLIILLKCIELAMPPGSVERTDLSKILVKGDGHLILLQTNNANEFIFNRFIRDGVSPQENEIETHSDSNLAQAISECTQFVSEWQKSKDAADLMRLVLHRLGFVAYDTEDSRVVYTVFEVLNSRGLAVDWLDKSKSVLMGRAYELSTTTHAAEAEIHGLQAIWSQIYREIAKEDVPGDEVLRVTATLYYGPGVGKPRSADESLELLRQECDALDKPRRVSEQLLDAARKLVSLYGNVRLGPVTDILHARLLAVAVMSARGVNEAERAKLLEQWERVTFRIFGLYGKDSRTKVGDYVRMAARIVAEDIEMRTYNQILTGIRLLGSDYPIDGAVTEGLVGKDCYERSAETCRYILWLYEEDLAHRLGAGATVDEHERNAIWRRGAFDSVEHVFPQNPEAEAGWRGKMRRGNGPEQAVEAHVGRIGNLLLLPIVLNQQAKVRPFLQKKVLYAKHHLRMIEEVCREPDWTLRQIESREKRIVEWARTRWCDL